MSKIHFDQTPVYDATLGCFKIPLRSGGFVLVDEEDLALVRSMWWSDTNTKGYAHTSVSMHRMIMHPPRGMQVDHINGNRLDNRRENLRIISAPQNCINRGKVTHMKGKACRSRFKGVHRMGPSRWQVRIKIPHGKALKLGSYNSEEEAARVYDAAALKYHGDFARTNAAMGLFDCNGDGEVLPLSA